MSSSSRVPLLVKSKGRIPSRVSIAPRSKPSNGPRTKRVATLDDDQQLDDQANMVKNQEAHMTYEASLAMAEATQSMKNTRPTEMATPAVKIASSKSMNGPKLITVVKPPLTPPVVENDSDAVDSRTSVGKASTVPIRRTGEISVSDQHPERLAKITSAGPLYRASSVVRSRAGSIGSLPSMRPRGISIGNSPAVKPHQPMKERLLRKLDIKPHQSPRRSAMQLQQQNIHNQDCSSSPLVLGGKPSGIVPDMQLNVQQSKCATTTETVRAWAVRAKKNQSVAAERRKRNEVTSLQTNANAREPQRRSLKRKAKCSTFREANSSDSSDSERDDDRQANVDSNDLDLPEDETNMYVPAREQATIWAKSLLQENGEGKKGYGGNDRGNSQALAVRKKKALARRKRSNSNASSVSSVVTGIGSGIMSRNKIKELMKKEPSEMTMGELALTVPKGRRMKRYEREEAALDTQPVAGLSGEGSSSLLNMNALNRVRSLSVSSESADFVGSLVTPQVQIIDGHMVVLENTIKLGDELQRSAADEMNAGGESTGLPPRHSGSRYNSSHSNGPGKRWGKEETKQFYYCLSQVGPNFSMMATLFPTRKRRELKSKFKYEEKNHGKLIEIALRASTAPLDSEMVDVISQMVDKEAQRKLDAQKTKRKSRLQHDVLYKGQDDDTPSVVNSMGSSPMSTPQVYTKEFVETLNDEDLFSSSRHDSFDFSG